MKGKGKRYMLYKNSIGILLILAICVDTLRAVYYKKIYSDITIPFLFLSLGLYIGFSISHHEIKRINKY